MKPIKSEPLELIHPARCVGVLPADLTKSHLVAEPKVDGGRYLLYIGSGVDPYKRQKGNTFLSRQESVTDDKYCDKTANLPHITDNDYKSLARTILDGEIFRHDIAYTVSVLNSSPANAITKQKEEGWLDYYAFDILVYKGESVRGLALKERRKLLEKAVKEMKNDNVRLLPQWTSDFADHFQELVDGGGEGLIIKDLRCGYGVGWAKMKKSYEVSLVVTGFHAADTSGSFSGMIGSLSLGCYDRPGGKLVEIAQASGFDEALRAKMTKNFEKYKGKVIDVFLHELGKPSAEHPLGRARHASYFRPREDVNPRDCTYEKVQEALNQKARHNRFKR